LGANHKANRGMARRRHPGQRPRSVQLRSYMKNLAFLGGFLLLSGLLAPASAPGGDPVYIADVITIGLRQGPDPKSSIIKALQSDTVLEILEERDKYLRVRTATGDEGWIPRQHVSSQTPKTRIIASLNTELAALKEKAQPLQGTSNRSAAEVQALQAQYNNVKAELDKLKSQASGDQTAMARQLTEITERYNTLREQSAHVTELGQENETLRMTNDKLGKDMEALRQEGTHLKRTDMIPWFLAGGGVFLAGFIIARLSSGKKKKSFY